MAAVATDISLTIGKNTRRCSERGAAFFFAQESRPRLLVPNLLIQELLLKRRKSIERVQWGHGKEVHLADFLEHGMRRWKCRIEGERLLGADD